jgi:phosphotransferase system IIB component|tara:strand:+ start:8425 stop:8664 length:240 start_codon:yes stop_codon:yes gene_type:complete
MDGHEYRLKEQTSNNISSIASCIDDLRSDLNHNSEVNSKRIDNGLGDVCTFIEALTSQIVVLNKNMERIANSMEENKCE